MKTSLRFTSIVVFLIAACLITPEISDTAAAINSNSTQHKGVKTLKLASEVAKHILSVANSDNEYQPPDYGGPDSHHGSGTR
jgi:acid phosphatase class B